MLGKWNTNETLLQRVKNRYDEISCKEFNEIYRPYLFVVIKGLNIRHHDAEELVQTIMIKLWNKLPQFEYSPEKCKFRSWLRTIAINAVRSYVVTKAYKQTSLEGIDETGAYQETLLSSETAMKEIADREWKTYICDMAWNNIKVAFSEKVHQVYEQMCEGIDCDVIANNIGIKRNTVYVYRKRIEDKLFAEIRYLNYQLGG